MPEKTFKTTIRHRKGYDFLFVYSPRTWQKIKMPVDVFEELTNVKIDPNKYKQFVDLSTFDFKQIKMWDGLDQTPAYLDETHQEWYREQMVEFQKFTGRRHPVMAQFLSYIHRGKEFEKWQEEQEAIAAKIDQYDNPGNEDEIPF